MFRQKVKKNVTLAELIENIRDELLSKIEKLYYSQVFTISISSAVKNNQKNISYQTCLNDVNTWLETGASTKATILFITQFQLSFETISRHYAANPYVGRYPEFSLPSRYDLNLGLDKKIYTCINNKFFIYLELYRQCLRLQANTMSYEDIETASIFSLINKNLNLSGKKQYKKLTQIITAFSGVINERVMVINANYTQAINQKKAVENLIIINASKLEHYPLVHEIASTDDRVLITAHELIHNIFEHCITWENFIRSKYFNRKKIVTKQQLTQRIAELKKIGINYYRPLTVVYTELDSNEYIDLLTAINIIRNKLARLIFITREDKIDAVVSAILGLSTAYFELRVIKASIPMLPNLYIRKNTNLIISQITTLFEHHGLLKSWIKNKISLDAYDTFDKQLSDWINNTVKSGAASEINLDAAVTLNMTQIFRDRLQSVESPVKQHAQGIPLRLIDQFRKMASNIVGSIATEKKCEQRNIMIPSKIPYNFMNYCFRDSETTSSEGLEEASGVALTTPPGERTVSFNATIRFRHFCQSNVAQTPPEFIEGHYSSTAVEPTNGTLFKSILK